jgi:hypothetical protein
MGQVSTMSERTVMMHEGVAIPLPPELAKALLDFVREKASGKLEINFANGSVAGVNGTKSKRYK